MAARAPAPHTGAVVFPSRWLLWSLAASLAAQPARMHVDSDLVLVPTIVTDHDYKPVFNLTERQFQLRVDRTPTPLAGFWKDTGPVSLVIVLDASGSMQNVLGRSQEALRGFLALAHPEDEYALVLCRDHGRVELPFTQDQRALSAAILAAGAHGSTPLLDSLSLALDLVKRGRHERKAILLISDGEDTSSRLDYVTLRRRVLESTAWLYVLQFFTGRPLDEFEFRDLRALAELTGGIFFDDVSPKRFAEYFAELDVHQRYVLAFRPGPSAGGQRQHRLEVRLKDVRLEKPRLFWRRSFQDGLPH